MPPAALVRSVCNLVAGLIHLQRCEGKGAEGLGLCVKYAPSRSCQVSTMYWPAIFPAEVRGQGGRGSAALCQIRSKPPLSGQYFGEQRAYSLCRDKRARVQRDHGSVSNMPPAALVRSVLCSGAPTPSAEMRGQGGRGSAALCQICPSCSCKISTV
jgi:hypothetical protein